MLLSLLVLMHAGCSKKQEAAGPGTPEVTLMTIVQQDVPVAPEYVAQTQSSRQVNIHARVSGFLEKRVYTEGEIVKEGQTLFLMDQKPFKVQLDQAKAALARQEAAHKTARQNYGRTKPLAEKNALSQKDLDDAKGQFDSTGAAVEQAKAQVEQAKLNLSYTVITSPVQGITSAALQQDGTYINPQNSQLTTVEALSPMWVNFSLSENELQRYRREIESGKVREPLDKNYIVEIILVDGSVFPYTGKITFAAPSYDTQTGTFLLRASVENPDGILRPNQFVRVRLKGAVRPKAILVPQTAVQQGSRGHFVWVVGTDDKAELRPVMVGDWRGTDWFITEGLKGGERVVVEGGMTVRPGAPVKIKDQKRGESTAATK
ncbi:MAG: efflux RND transporter periplasmic adaptor subunit [Deltaproteobacteria bacterium]|nr:efflux RND transporter periplasmic adaptor subunit [Deltaproteobacteria bacterium]